jgi:hypothetical protein
MTDRFPGAAQQAVNETSCTALYLLRFFCNTHYLRCNISVKDPPRSCGDLFSSLSYSFLADGLSEFVRDLALPSETS